jgi:hypothetical protein
VIEEEEGQAADEQALEEPEPEGTATDKREKKRILFGFRV